VFGSTNSIASIELSEVRFLTSAVFGGLSVLCLSVCNIVGRYFNFSAIFLHRLIARGLGQFLLKFGAKIPWIVHVKYKGYVKVVFSTNILLYFKNGTTYGHGLQWKTNRPELVCDLSNGVFSNHR